MAPKAWDVDELIERAVDHRAAPALPGDMFWLGAVLVGGLGRDAARRVAQGGQSQSCSAR